MNHFYPILFQYELTNFVESKLVLYNNDGINVDSESFKKLFRNTPEIRKLLFGRHNLKAKSIFEEILSKFDYKQIISDENFDDVLSFIWNEFRLWEVPEIWTMVSTAGLDFLFGSGWSKRTSMSDLLKLAESYSKMRIANIL